jgi:hypothetical protein
MRLTTEEMGNLPDVDAATLDEVLGHEAFGKFAILSKSEEEFVQTGCDWRPGPRPSPVRRRHAAPAPAGLRPTRRSLVPVRLSSGTHRESRCRGPVSP